MATTAKIAKEAKTPKYKIRLRNRCRLCGRPRAYIRKFAMCRLCFRKLKAEIARILQDEGYIQGFRLVDEPAEREGRQPRQVIRVFLKYGPHGEKVISGLERISRPGRRVYLGVEDVPTVLGGLGTSIL